MKPYEYGQEAYIAGLSVSDNPFHTARLLDAQSRIAWQQWRSGWIQEQDDRIEITQHMLSR